MDKRIMMPDFLSNNIAFVQEQAKREGLKLVITSNGPEVQEIEDGD